MKSGVRPANTGDDAKQGTKAIHTQELVDRTAAGEKMRRVLWNQTEREWGAYIAERVIAAVDLFARLLRHCVEQLIVVIGVDELKSLK